MKHLKKYKIFEAIENKESVKKYCKDILLELGDIGFTCTVKDFVSNEIPNFSDGYGIQVEIVKPSLDIDDNDISDPFSISEVIDAILSTSNYLKDIGYNFSLFSGHSYRVIKGDSINLYQWRLIDGQKCTSMSWEYNGYKKDILETLEELSNKINLVKDYSLTKIYKLNLYYDYKGI